MRRQIDGASTEHCDRVRSARWMLRRSAMCPIDPSPHGGEILHERPERKFPQPAADGEHGDSERELRHRGEAAGEADIAQRPSLPEQPQQMAVDIEDEEADPVIDSGPGIADGVDGAGRRG
jgi:hypothetical protein